MRILTRHHAGSRRAAAAVFAVSLLLGQSGCVQRSVATYREAAIRYGPAGFLEAAPGEHAVFERGRFVHYPLPFAWSGEALFWQIAPERVRAGATLALPDTGIVAIYQRFGHPVRRGFRDVRGTIHILEATPSQVVADFRVRSDSGSWAHSGRVRYPARRVEPDRSRDRRTPDE